MDLDDLLEHYESVWLERIPSLNELASTYESFRSASTAVPSDATDALSELIKIDIHHRWMHIGESRRGGVTESAGCHVEDYAAHFPEIQTFPDYPDGFLLEELVARTRKGEGISADSIAERFPSLRVDQIERLLREAHRTVEIDGGSRVIAATADVHSATGDRFEIQRLLGQGSMGRVYLAYDPRLQREVAIKVPVADDPVLRKRFLREGRAAAALGHPNIVAVYETGDSPPFIASEFVAGPTLKDWLADHGPLNAETAARLMLLIARGVASAHDKGIVHRDLKPSNVLLSPVTHGDGSSGTIDTSVELAGQSICPKVADFGLADFLDSTVGLTLTGATLGTAAYMSPEQATGGQAGHASDVFSLGVILYELVAGRSPFAQDTFAGTLDRIRTYEPKLLHRSKLGVAKDLSAICHRALTKEATGRYTSAKELAEDLQRYLSGKPVNARTPGIPERTARWCRRNPAVALLTSLVCIALLWSLWQNRRLTDALTDSEELRIKADVAEKEVRNANLDLREANAQYQQEVYVQDMILAFNAWDQRDAPAVRTLLAKCIPENGAPDRRGAEWYVLERLSQDHGHLKFIGHTDEVRSIRVSKNKKHFFTASRDMTLRKWSLATGKQLWKREFKNESPRSIVLMDDGQRLIAGDNFVREYRTSDGRPGKPITFHSHPVEAMAISHDEQLLATTGVQTDLKVTGLGENGYSENKMGVPSFRTRRIDFSPNGEFLFFCRYAGDEHALGTPSEFVVWNVEKEKPELTLLGASGSVDASPDGRLVAVAGRWIRLYDVKRREWIGKSQVLKDMGCLDLEFDSTGRRLAVAETSGTVEIIEVGDVSPISSSLPITHSFRVARHAVNTVTWVDDNRLLCGDNAGGVHLLTIPDLADTIQRFPLDFISFLNDGEMLVTRKRELEVFNTSSMELIGTIPGFSGKPIHRIVADPTGRWFVISWEHKAWVWDMKERKLLGEFEHDIIVPQTKLSTWRIKDISVNAEGHVATVGAGGSDFSLQIREPKGLQRVHTVSFSDLMKGVVFSPDGTRLFVVQGDTTSVFDMPSMERVDVPKFRGIRWYSQTQLIGSQTGSPICFYDLEQDRVVRAMGEEGESHTYSRQRLSPDRKTLITGNHSEGIRFWHLATGRHLGHLATPFQDLAFRSDGRGIQYIDRSANGWLVQNVGGLTLSKQAEMGRFKENSVPFLASSYELLPPAELMRRATFFDREAELVGNGYLQSLDILPSKSSSTLEKVMELQLPRKSTSQPTSVEIRFGTENLSDNGGLKFGISDGRHVATIASSTSTSPFAAELYELSGIAATKTSSIPISTNLGFQDAVEVEFEFLPNKTRITARANGAEYSGTINALDVSKPLSLVLIAVHPDKVHRLNYLSYFTHAADDRIDVSVIEGEQPLEIDLLQHVFDEDDDELKVDSLVFESGSWTGISHSGNSLQVLPNSYAHLHEGETEVVECSYDVNDGNGGRVRHRAVIAIHGADDESTEFETRNVIDLASLKESDGTTIYGKESGDHFGWCVASAGDMNGDGRSDFVINANNAAARGNKKKSAGESYVFLGRETLPRNFFVSDADVTIFGADSEDYSGNRIAAGDFNGDGYDDLVLSAESADGSDNASDFAGEVYVVFGQEKLPKFIDLASREQIGMTIYGADPGDKLREVSNAGDVNGDGIEDMILGARAARGAENAIDRCGESYIIFGSKALPSEITVSELEDLGVKIDGIDAVDLSGSDVAGVGDVNGDGFDDVVISALISDSVGNERQRGGEAYVIFGAATMPSSIRLSELGTKTSYPGFTLYGAWLGDNFGVAVSGASDVNGDGFDDIVVGARGADGKDRQKLSAGCAYIIHGCPELPRTIDLAKRHDFVTEIFGADSGDQFGEFLSSAGDFNADGFADILISSALGDGIANSRFDAGETYVLFGDRNLPSTIDTAELGNRGLVFSGVTGNDKTGHSVCSLGDANGDGINDILIGSFRGDGPRNRMTNAGEVYLVFGKTSSSELLNSASLVEILEYCTRAYASAISDQSLELPAHGFTEASERSHIIQAIEQQLDLIESEVLPNSLPWNQLRGCIEALEWAAELAKGKSHSPIFAEVKRLESQRPRSSVTGNTIRQYLLTIRYQIGDRLGCDE